jgi:RNA polymerase sigma-70 factor, ECF subfamily
MGVLVSRALPIKASEALGDDELVRRALTGDRWGREMLYRRHAGSLLAMTVRLLANRGEAEEIVQDTFVTAFEQLGTLREPGAVRAWLGQIAVNLVRRRFRGARMVAPTTPRWRRWQIPGCPPTSAPSWPSSTACCAE